jgi:hypothetical protein
VCRIGSFGARTVVRLLAGLLVRLPAAGEQQAAE